MLESTAAVLRLLATATNAAAEGFHTSPTCLTLSLGNGSLVEFLVDQKLRTANTDAVQDIHDHRKELDEIDWAGQTVMAKVTGTIVIRLFTAAACFPII